MFVRLPCVAEIICKTSQSNVLQRECELMLLGQEMEELEESLESQVHLRNTSAQVLQQCVFVSIHQLQELGVEANVEDDKIRAELEVVEEQHR